MVSLLPWESIIPLSTTSTTKAKAHITTIEYGPLDDPKGVYLQYLLDGVTATSATTIERLLPRVDTLRRESVMFPILSSEQALVLHMRIRDTIQHYNEPSHVNILDTLVLAICTEPWKCVRRGCFSLSVVERFANNGLTPQTNSEIISLVDNLTNSWMFSSVIGGNVEKY